MPGPERLTRSSTRKRSSRVSVTVKCAIQIWSRSHAEGAAASTALAFALASVPALPSAALDLRKNVRSKPKCRPAAVERFPVYYHHSESNDGCAK